MHKLQIIIIRDMIIKAKAYVLIFSLLLSLQNRSQMSALKTAAKY